MRRRPRGSTRRSPRPRARGPRAGGRCRARGGRSATDALPWKKRRNAVGRSLRRRPDGPRPGTVPGGRVASAGMGELRFGPARIPSRESPEEALELLVERGYTACEIDFEGKFWMDYDFAARLGELARERGIALSVHAPIAGFMGHAERGKKLNMAVGMLDHSAGIARAAGAELVVFHPGFLLGRPREAAIDSIVEQLGELRDRLEAKDRAVPFGIEVMGRVREIGSADDVVEISRRLGWVRPVLDFAHMHATSDGAFLTEEPFAAELAKADAVLEP